MPLSRLKTEKRSFTDIQHVVSDLVTHILTHAGQADIYLIGSYVRGAADEFSDIDLVVVIPDAQDPAQTSFAISQNRPWRKFAVDLMVINRHEFEKMCDTGGIAFEAKHHGKLLSSAGAPPK